MPLENATYISDLVTSNPAASDGMNNADDHMRLIKAALKASFPGFTGALTNSAGGILVPADGAAAGPAFAFRSEPGLGFYRSAAGIMSFTGILRGVGAINPGALQDFAMDTAPAGWLVCDGQAVSRATYADLFTAINTTWGVGDGTTTFNVPNLVSRFRRHRQVGGNAGAVGNTQGPVNLTHTHGVSGGTGVADTDHTHSGRTGDDSPDHTHTSPTYGGLVNIVQGGASTWTQVWQALANAVSGGASARHQHNFTTGGMSTNHAHAINLTSGASGDANEARPYSATVLTCIKT